jgi:hypothetical protein
VLQLHSLWLLLLLLLLWVVLPTSYPSYHLA